MNTRNVKVYTTPTCPWCRRAKDFLSRHNIPFEEIDVRDPSRAEELINLTGQTAVPVLDINGKLIVGFDEVEIKNALGIK